MNRRYLLARLLGATTGLFLAACATPEYGAPKFTIEVDSEPEGAVLYVLEERDYNRMTGELESLDLGSKRIGRTAPGVTLTTTVRAYRQVLVGEWDGRRSEFRFTPSRDGEKFTVTAP